MVKTSSYAFLLFFMCSILVVPSVESSDVESSDVESSNIESSDLNTKTLEAFSPNAREIITGEISRREFDGVIPAAMVNQLLEFTEYSQPSDIMLKLLPLASSYALPVTSNFYVGAVTEGESGNLYLGANLEIAGVDLNNSIHAEQSAINNALLHHEIGIKSIAITAAPCGHCRQFLNEIKDAGNIEIYILGAEPARLKELLPQSFGPSELGSQYPLFTVDKTHRAVNEKLCEVIHTNHQHSDHVCVHSYSPHTGSFSSVLLQTRSGVHSVGTYIENVAYNPSLSPLHSALDRLRFSENDFSQITEAMLVEMEEANVSHEVHTSFLLSLIAPNASFKTVKIAHPN